MKLQHDKKVFVTASTRMARLQFVDGQTIHHWSGYGDGHEDIQVLIERILTSASYGDIWKNILDCETLVIDEIDMLSCKTLESVKLVCR